MGILEPLLLTLAVGVPAVLLPFAEETRPSALRAKIQRHRSRTALPEDLQGGHDLQVEDWLNGAAVFVLSQVDFDNLRSVVASHRIIARRQITPFGPTSPTELERQAVEIYFKLGAHDRLMQVIDEEARRTKSPTPEFIEFLRTALNGISSEGKVFPYRWKTATQGTWYSATPKQRTGEQQQKGLLAETSKELASLVKWKYGKNNNQLRKALTKGQVPL